MKKHLFNTMVPITLITVIIFVSGCGCRRYPAPDLSPFNLKAVSSQNIKILWVDSHKMENNLIVHGTFRRQIYNADPMKAHIDIKILSDNGNLTHEVHTEDIYLPVNQPGKGSKFKRFEIILEDIFPDNSTIVVSAHQGNHDV